jgi:hypothetical protein
MSEESVDVLRGPHVLEYPYRRSLGPVLARFFNDLRDGRLTGIRSKTSGVSCRGPGWRSRERSSRSIGPSPTR